MQLLLCVSSGLNPGSLRHHSKNLIKYILLLASMLLGGVAHAVGSSELSVGIFPRRDTVATRAMFQPVMDYLQQELKLKVTLDVPPDFEAFWSRLKENRYDLVHLNQYQYLRAHHQLGYDAILKNEEMGQSEIASVIWVRRGSGINQPADLRGKKVIFGGGKQAMMSYIMAVDLLREQGLYEADYLVRFAVNPVSAVLSLYYRQSMAAGAGDVLPQLPVLKEHISLSEIKPLLRSKPVAQLPWAVSPALSEKTSLRIKQALAKLKQTGTGRQLLSHAGLSGLVVATDKDYDPHREIVARILQEHY